MLSSWLREDSLLVLSTIFGQQEFPVLADNIAPWTRVFYRKGVADLLGFRHCLRHVICDPIRACLINGACFTALINEITTKLIVSPESAQDLAHALYEVWTTESYRPYIRWRPGTYDGMSDEHETQ
jgi:hypothetical protein